MAESLWLKCIGCEVFARPIYWCAARSPHTVDVTLLEIGLHNRPEELRRQIQAQVDSAAERGYAAVLLAYGLCGQAADGLQANGIPLVIPRAHDCITLFLGSRARYREEFENCPGTYWYTPDYCERRRHSASTLALGSGNEADLQSVYEEYVARYGKGNADYLMEALGAWQQHYRRAVFVDQGVAEAPAIEREVQAEAARRGWTYQRMAGDLVLLRRLLWGEWDPPADQDLLILQPGQRIRATYDEEILGCLSSR